MLSPWLAGSRQIDLDRAREQALALAALPPEPSFMSERLEREVLALIGRAGEDVRGS
jgi:hypothetical protein